MHLWWASSKFIHFQKQKFTNMFADVSFTEFFSCRGYAFRKISVTFLCKLLKTSFTVGFIPVHILISWDDLVNLQLMCTHFAARFTSVACALGALELGPCVVFASRFFGGWVLWWEPVLVSSPGLSLWLITNACCTSVGYKGAGPQQRFSGFLKKFWNEMFSAPSLRKQKIVEQNGLECVWGSHPQSPWPHRWWWRMVSGDPGHHKHSAKPCCGGCWSPLGSLRCAELLLGCTVWSSLTF